MNSGTLLLKDASWLALDNLGPKAVWSGGNLSENGDVNAKIYVHNSTTFTIQTDATRLGATLVIGQTQTGADQPGTINIAKEDGTGNLADNVTLFKNAGIEVKPQGILNLHQTVNSSTKGGIVSAVGSTGAIDNKGRISRTVVVLDPEQYLTIGPKVTNSAGGAVFVMGAGTKINFAGGFDVNNGAFEKHDDADTKGNVVPKAPGKIKPIKGPNPGAHQFFFRDNLKVEGGSIEFIQTVAGAYGTVQIDGNFELDADATIDNFEVKSDLLGDRFVIGINGTVTVDGWLNIVEAPGFTGGNTIMLIENNGPGIVNGYFDNLPDGGEISLGTDLYKIRYNVGNNDLVLYRIMTGQPASCVVSASSEFNASPGDFSAAQALGSRNTFSYGFMATAWAPAAQSGSQEYLQVCFLTPVNAQGVTIRETLGNGFVTQVDLVDTSGGLHPVWAGTDPNQPGSPAELTLTFSATSYLVQGVKVYVNTNHSPNTFEQIDAILLYGEARGGLAPLMAGTGSAGAVTALRVSSLARPNVGPFATFAVSGPVARGVPVTFLFSEPRGGSGYRYSFDFNNDGDFSDPGERAGGTSPSAQHTFSRRGWHVVRGRLHSADGRFTDFWVPVFIP